jgi:hypothetical protein
MTTVDGGRREQVHTLVIGAGQAGLATSYWLQRAGVEHLLVERRPMLGGTWPDRWDSFTLVGPNYTLRLPGMFYSGPDPEGFMPRDQVVRYVQEYATFVGAAVRLGTGIDRLVRSNGRFEAQSQDTTFEARNVVLATGPYQRPSIPEAARSLSDRIQRLHSNEYRRPGQLAAGAVLVVGTGQSGAQIAEELMQAGREVHLAVSMCPSIPRRYRGRDSIWWLLQSFLHGAEVGVKFPTVDDLPTPAARFACNPHVSGRTEATTSTSAGWRLRGCICTGGWRRSTGQRCASATTSRSGCASRTPGSTRSFGRCSTRTSARRASTHPRTIASHPTASCQPRARSSTSSERAFAAWCGRRDTGSTSAGCSCRSSTNGGIRGTSAASRPARACMPSGCRGSTLSRPRCSPASERTPLTSSST